MSCRFSRIDGQISGSYFDIFPYRLSLLQFQRERDGLTRTQHKLVARGIKTWRLSFQFVGAGIDSGKMEFAARVSDGAAENRSFGAPQGDRSTRHGIAGHVADKSLHCGLGSSGNDCAEDQEQEIGTHELRTYLRLHQCR